MNKQNFELLIGSMREGAQILRGECKPARRFVVRGKDDVRQVRQAFHASQGAFAKFMGVSVGTVRNWEQGRRRPTGAARVLLTIALRQPELFRSTMAEDCPELAFS